MNLVTPGTTFLFHHLLGPALLFTTLLICTRYLALPIPAWLLAFLTLLSVPLRVAAGVVLQERHDRREAEAMGARIAPRPEGVKIGNIDLLKWLMASWKGGYPGDGLRNLIAVHGPIINLRFLWSNTIFTVSPECIKIILTDTDNYVKGDRFRYAMGSVLGNGVFNSDGDMWKFHRSMTRPFFSRDRVRAFELFDRHVATVVQRIRDRMHVGEAVDFQDLMHRFTLDSGTDFLFGSCVDSLQIDAEELPQPYSLSSPSSPLSSSHSDPNSASAFSTAFLHAQQVIAERERLGWIWPLLEIRGDKTEADMRVVNAYLERVVREAVGRNKGKGEKKVDTNVDANGEGEVDSEETLLDHLVGITSDPALLKDEILNILIATRDTMAATLTFTIYFLSQHPDVIARLRAEIIATVGTTRRPTYEDVKGMKYLKAVINECLRLLPPVPYNVRSPLKSTTWPSPDPSQKPIYIPKGAATSYGVIMMHTRKDLWGPDAGVFDPDRFLDERLKKYLIPNPFIFLPFNAGPRICLGQQFAYNQISFILIRLLQTFSSVSLCLDAFPPSARPPAEWANGPQAAEDIFGCRKTKEKFRPKIVLTMSSEGGMWVKMREE